MSKDGLLTPVFSKTHLLKRKSAVNNTAFSSSSTNTTIATIEIIHGAEIKVTASTEIQKVNKPAGSPVWASTVTGVCCAAAAGFLPMDFLAETTSIGALFAFIMVHLSVIIMHWTHKPQKKVKAKQNTEIASDLSHSIENLAEKNINTRFTFPSRTLPCPIVGILMCLLLMWSTTKWTKVRFVCWNFAIGQAVYWLYGRKHSILGNKPPTNPENDPTNACGYNIEQGQQQHSHDLTKRKNIAQTIIDIRAISVSSAEKIEAHGPIITIRV